MTSLEEDHLLDTTKDNGGARVIEAFLTSNASTKQKRKLIVKYATFYKNPLYNTFVLFMFDSINISLLLCDFM